MKKLLRKASQVVDFKVAGPHVKDVKVRIPVRLRRHPGFQNAEIRVDEDQIHFHLKGNDSSDLPEIWVYDANQDGWACVQFITDKANPQV